MKLSNLFKKKELTEKELAEREYKKEMKVIRRKLFKNPTTLDVRLKEAEDLMNRAVKDGLMTQKEMDKVLLQYSKDFDKVMRIVNKVQLR